MRKQRKVTKDKITLILMTTIRVKMHISQSKKIIIVIHFLKTKVQIISQVKIEILKQLNIVMMMISN